MPRKSNKTAHVLGLITNEKPTVTADDEEAAGQSPKPTRKAVVRKTAPATMENHGVNTSKLAEDIRGKLLDELDGPTPNPQESPERKISYLPYEPEAAASSASVPDNNKLIDNAADESNLLNTMPIEGVVGESNPLNNITENDDLEQASKVPPLVKTVVADYPLEDFGAVSPAMEPAVLKPVVVEPTAVPLTPPSTPHTAAPAVQIASDPYIPPTHAPYIYINVLEELVKERGLAHMQTFDMCLCNRCVMDTMALALTSLPSKYVVVEKGEGIPLLNYYGSRFQIQVIAELTKACMTVKAFPHH